MADHDASRAKSYLSQTHSKSNTLPSEKASFSFLPFSSCSLW